MAARPKKTNTRSSAKKRPARKRKGKKDTTFKKSLLIVLGVFLMIFMVAFGYFLGKNDRVNGHTPVTHTYKTDEKESTKKLLEALSKIKREKTEEKLQKNTERPFKKEVRKEKDTPIKSLMKAEVKEGVSKTKKHDSVRLADRGRKPRLAIIIDDVAVRSQLQKIHATGLKLTPSIFPPSQRSMHSHRLAKELEHYMIHLPMESGYAQFNKQTKTLMTMFSKKQIEARVKEIRRLFPSARYVNNHTGSVFTDDYDAMQALYHALRNEGFSFVDSRTIASTKVPRITDEYGDAYVARDVFIDNEHHIPYIHGQLQKAVKLAKERGYAIAIGHPHKTTMQALSTAASIFQDVELVYIDELYQ